MTNCLRCGHPKQEHEHNRPGTDCSHSETDRDGLRTHCGCHEYVGSHILWFAIRAANRLRGRC